MVLVVCGSPGLVRPFVPRVETPPEAPSLGRGRSSATVVNITFVISLYSYLARVLTRLATV